MKSVFQPTTIYNSIRIINYRSLIKNDWKRLAQTLRKKNFINKRNEQTYMTICDIINNEFRENGLASFANGI